MAKESSVPKKRQIKKPQTVRERAKSKKPASAQPRRIRRASSAAGKPFKQIGKYAANAVRPFSFLLIPFRTKPARLVGRVIASVLLLKFIRGSFAELRQVTWPDRKETAKLTIAVFMFAIFFGVLISVVDYGLDRLFKDVILK